MMNRMRFEAIKHEEAQKATEGTYIDWTDLLDNTHECEREVENLDEAGMHEYWEGYFTDIVAEIIWEDSQIKAE